MSHEEIIEVVSVLKANDKTMKDNGISNNLWAKAVECILFLQSENAALCERLEKAIELKVKVGDTIYMPWIWNGNSGIAGLIVREIQIVGDGVTYYITSFTTDDLAFAAHYKFGKFEEYYFGNMVFTTPEAATVRLKELKGEAK